MERFKEAYFKYFWHVVFAIILITCLPYILNHLEVLISFLASVYANGIEIIGKPLASVTLGELILLSILFNFVRYAVIFAWAIYKVHICEEE